MNPLPMVRAELRSLRLVALAIMALVAIAVAIGVGINAQERALRKGSAKATEDFDLLIGAPGSPMQLLLSTVFLQEEALPLLPPEILERLKADRRAKGIAPLAPGDVVRGYPVIGTSRDFVTRFGRVTPAEGRSFDRPGEAVVGADVRLALGASFQPSHAIAGAARHPGEDHADEAEHRHAGAEYTIVGRLPRLGTPWDRAVLVPVESVWAIHGLLPDPRTQWPRRPDGSSAAPAPSVPAIVVRVGSVAEAYQLRSEYRQGGTMAFFPAEVLVQLYGVIGDVRTILVAASAFNAVLIFSAVLLLIWTIATLRRRRYALLRALGAPRGYILLVVWLTAASLIAAGALAGLALGWGVTMAIGRFAQGATGLALDFVFAGEDIAFAAGLVGAGSMLALVPALMSYRLSLARGLAGPG